MTEMSGGLQPSPVYNPIDSDSYLSNVDSPPPLLEIRNDNQIPMNSINNHPKPKCSMATLIRLAIHSSPEKIMTLQEIYEYISKNFPYYDMNKTSWKNTVRHTLSLLECFKKRPRADKRSSFWEVDYTQLKRDRRRKYDKKEDKQKASANICDKRESVKTNEHRHKTDYVVDRMYYMCDGQSTVKTLDSLNFGGSVVQSLETDEPDTSIDIKEEPLQIVEYFDNKDSVVTTIVPNVSVAVNDRQSNSTELTDTDLVVKSLKLDASIDIEKEPCEIVEFSDIKNTVVETIAPNESIDNREKSSRTDKTIEINEESNDSIEMIEYFGYNDTGANTTTPKESIVIEEPCKIKCSEDSDIKSMHESIVVKEKPLNRSAVYSVVELIDSDDSVEIIDYFGSVTKTIVPDESKVKEIICKIDIEDSDIITQSEENPDNTEYDMKRFGGKTITSDQSIGVKKQSSKQSAAESVQNLLDPQRSAVSHDVRTSTCKYVVDNEQSIIAKDNFTYNQDINLLEKPIFINNKRRILYQGYLFDLSRMSVTPMDRSTKVVWTCFRGNVANSCDVKVYTINDEVVKIAGTHVCGAPSNIKDDYNAKPRPVLPETNIKTQLCPICFMPFVALRNHITSHLLTANPTCKDCDTEFTSRPDLINHICKKSYICEICDETLKNVHEIDIHMLSSHIRTEIEK